MAIIMSILIALTATAVLIWIEEFDLPMKKGMFGINKDVVHGIGVPNYSNVILEHQQ
jgi:hypothetical protein